MKLKYKLPLITCVIVFISITFVSCFLIYEFRKRTLEDIVTFKKEEVVKLKQHIKDIVELSYEMIDLSYRSPEDIELIEQIYGNNNTNSIEAMLRRDSLVDNVRKDIMSVTLRDLRVLRYDNGEGYIWINTFEKPYRVVMHPTKPELEGKSLDTPEFNITTTGENIYEAFAKLCEEQGGGFIEYPYEKPGTNMRTSKISYIKLFKPKNWVIGTGVYIDNIDKKVILKAQSLNEKVNKMILMTLLLSVLLIAISMAFLFWVSNSMTDSIIRINNQLQQIAKGKFPKIFIFDRQDEIGEIKKSLDKLIKSFRNYTSFANSIGRNNFDVEFYALSKEDELGNSLLEMRDSLKISKQEDKKRKEEDEIRTWITAGQAKFAEILRHHTDNLSLLGDNVVFNLIKYLDANQAGLFIFKDNDSMVLELIASYAYDRKKYHDKEFELGEGLIGTCAIEKKSIYMTKIPANYIEITSGLGEATPRNLLLVPLISEEKVMGVIEISSFNKIEPYIIEFVEKIAENIASTLSITKINTQTQNLLRKSQETSEMLASQEEEMRQNIEELKSTQEESYRVEKNNDIVLSAIDRAILRVELSLDGSILFMNNEFARILSINNTKDNMKKIKLTSFISEKELISFNKEWEKVIMGEFVKKDITLRSKLGKIISVGISLSPIRSRQEVDKIIMIAYIKN